MNSSDSSSRALSRLSAFLQILGVNLIIFGTIFLLDRLHWRAIENQNGAYVVFNVFAIGIAALLFIYFFTSKDIDRWESLGLKSESILNIIAFGFLGVMLCYFASIIVVILYKLFDSYLLPHLASRVDLNHEIKQKINWMSVLGKTHFAFILPLAGFAGFYEEIVFRGFILNRLKILFTHHKLSLKTTLLLSLFISSFLFSMGHGYQGVLGLLQTFAVGMVLGFIAIWRKSIWPCIFAHFAIDTFGLVAIHFLKPLLEKYS